MFDTYAISSRKIAFYEWAKPTFSHYEIDYVNIRQSKINTKNRSTVTWKFILKQLVASGSVITVYINFAATRLSEYRLVITSPSATNC